MDGGKADDLLAPEDVQKYMLRIQQVGEHGQAAAHSDGEWSPLVHVTCSLTPIFFAFFSFCIFSTLVQFL